MNHILIVIYINDIHGFAESTGRPCGQRQRARAYGEDQDQDQDDETLAHQLSPRLSSKTFSPSSAGYSRGREAEKLLEEIWNSTPGLVSQIPDFGP